MQAEADIENMEAMECCVHYRIGTQNEVTWYESKNAGFRANARMELRIARFDRKKKSSKNISDHMEEMLFLNFLQGQIILVHHQCRILARVSCHSDVGKLLYMCQMAKNGVYRKSGFLKK
jgi:hypothetical protein